MKASATPITPDYRITNLDSGKDLTEALRPFLASLSVTESSDAQTDTLHIRLDGNAIDRFPASGTSLNVQLGYKETGLVDFGDYKVDTKTLSGMPLELSLKAGATDFNAPYKSQKSRNWDSFFLSDILSHLALTNGLELVIDPEFDGIATEYLSQKQESDMNLIARLAKEYGAEGTIKDGKLMFKVKGKTSSITDISPSQLATFRITWFDKPHYDSVVASWHDRNSLASTIEAYDGKSFTNAEVGNAYHIKQIFSNQFHARKSAKAEHKTINEQATSAQFEVPGNPNIVSKKGLRLKGFNADMDGTVLYITSVNHSIGGSGYRTSIEAKTLDEEAGADA